MYEGHKSQWKFSDAYREDAACLTEVNYRPVFLNLTSSVNEFSAERSDCTGNTTYEMEGMCYIMFSVPLSFVLVSRGD